jgi:hypothetical protein
MRESNPLHLLRPANILEMNDQIMRTEHEKEKSTK